MAKKRPPEFHPLLRNQPATPQPTTMVTLIGYLGPAESAGAVRLYTDRTFAHYYEFPAEDVLHQEPDPTDPVGPTRVYVPATTAIDVNHAPLLQGRLFRLLYTQETVETVSTETRGLESPPPLGTVEAGQAVDASRVAAVNAAAINLSPLICG
jgi:hypothetical protein